MSDEIKKDEIVVQTEDDVKTDNTSTQIVEEMKLDPKKLDEDLLLKISSLIDEKFKAMSSPKSSNSSDDISKLIEKEVNNRLVKMEYDMFMNNLKDDESELIKSIPDYNKLSIQQLRAIITKSSSLPKLNPKVGGSKDESLDELAKKARGGR